MRIIRPVGTLLAMSLFTATLGSAQTPATQSAPPTPAVKVGDPAPDFTLPYRLPIKPGEKSERREVRLSDFKGEKNVVVAFFVAAFSPG